MVVEVEEEGKADFQEFNDESEEDEFDAMRFSFGSKPREGSMTKSVNFNEPAAKSGKRKEKKESVQKNPTMPIGHVGS
ncbi:unnamed protein product [Musa textilis]